MKDIHDINQIKSRLAPQIEQLVKQLYPEGTKEGNSFRIGSLSGEKGRSLNISLSPNKPGDFFDHATAENGSIFKLVAEAKGISIRKSIEWLASYTNSEPIKSLETKKKEVNSEELAKKINPLSDRDYDKILEARLITKETLDTYEVGRGINQDILFPHYINETKSIGLLKHWVLSEKKIWSNENPIHSLFGKPVCDPDVIGTDQLVIAEGQWDAMSLYEVGIPAVSIPSGVTNSEWIAEDYAFLSMFEKIVLVFDNDEAGEKAARDAAFRLGESRCVIVTLPLKDPNDMLRAQREDDLKTAIESGVKQPLTEILDPEELRSATLMFCRGDNETQGIPFFIPEFDFYFRWHEMTLFFAPTSHGKSTMVQNQVAYLASLGEKCVIASFEQHPANTLGAILMAQHCRANLPYEEEQFDAAYKELTENVFMYKSRRRVDPNHLLKTFEHAHKQHGISHFVIDNVMTLGIDRSDNTQQGNTADLFREFVANYPVHLYIVAHPRKPPEEPKGPPSICEIQGASEWGNMPDNIIAVWRNIEKQGMLEQMRQDNIPEKEIRSEWASSPDGQIICRKQRLNGRVPSSPIYFHQEVKRMSRYSKTPHPFQKDN